MIRIVYYTEFGSNLMYLRELISSLHSLSATHELELSNLVVDIYTSSSCVNVLYDTLIGFQESEVLSKSLDFSIHALPQESISPNNFLNKILVIRDAVSSMNSGFCIFCDTDYIFVSNFIGSVLSLMQNSSFDLSVSHECGSTGFLPFPAHNTGLMFIAANSSSKDFLQVWYNKSLMHEHKGSQEWNDQFSFVEALNVFNLRLLTLEKLHNMRFHPVFQTSDYVWGPIHGIHNHDVSQFYFDVYIKSGFIRTNAPRHESIDSIVNERMNGFAPRHVRFLGNRVTPRGSFDIAYTN